MKAPIFAFTDDLDIFRSCKGAECYLESWEVETDFEGFDSEGRVLAATVDLKPDGKLLWIIPVQSERVVISETEKVDPEKLRLKLISCLMVLEPQSLSEALLSEFNLEELAELAVKHKGYSD